jgi:predicted translin family RNA/ssDNA-binding protein
MKFRATHVQLRAVNSALAMVKKTLHIDRAEVVMGDEEAQRSASQLFFSTISKQTTLLGDLEAILVLAEEYLNGQQAAAGEVGRQFLTFLADGVVPWIDEAVVLARIHA